MRKKVDTFVAIVMQDPAVDSVLAFMGGGQKNRAQMFVSLKPLKAGREPIDRVMTRLRTATGKEPGANVFLNPIQDLRGGGRQSEGSTQFTLRGDDFNELRAWGQKLEQALRDRTELTDVSSDQQNRGLQTSLVIDRVRRRAWRSTRRSTRPSVSVRAVAGLTITRQHQSRVVMEPRDWGSPETLIRSMSSRRSRPLPLSQSRASIRGWRRSR